MKAPSEEEANKWLKAIKEIREIYLQKNLKDIEVNRKWKLGIGVDTTQKVMEEIERKPGVNQRRTGKPSRLSSTTTRYWKTKVQTRFLRISRIG